MENEIIKRFDNELVDWNSPRFLSENKTVEDVRQFILSEIKALKEELIQDSLYSDVTKEDIIKAFAKRGV